MKLPLLSGKEVGATLSRLGFFEVHRKRQPRENEAC